MSVTISLAGESVVVRADRAAYWPRRQTLIVADLHFGKAAAFRAASLPIPGDSEATLARLSAAVDDTRATRLVVLGDFWHAASGRTAGVLEALANWRQARPGLELVLVKGNHDRAGPPPAGWASAWHAEDARDGPFVFAHHPSASDAGYVLSGHLHPGYRLSDHGQRLPPLPCFWVRDHYAVFPAFGSFTGYATVLPTAGDRVLVVAGDEVIPIPT